MNRRQRGVVSNVDFYEHPKFKIRIPISLDKDGGTFCATYGQETFRNTELQRLKDALFAYIQSTTSLEWLPIIQVAVSGSSRTITDVINDEMHDDETYQRKFEHIMGELSIDAERYWIAKRPNGSWMKCETWDSRDWDAEGLEADSAFLASGDRRMNATDFYEANNNKDFALPFSVGSHREGTRYFLPYDENLWNALNVIGDKMALMLAQLIHLIGTVKGRQKLGAFAQKLLPSGEREAAAYKKGARK